MNKDELVEGIQILTPAEVEASSTPPVETTPEPPTEQPIEKFDEEPDFAIVPPTETTDGKVEKDDDNLPPATPSNDEPQLTKYQALLTDLANDGAFGELEEGELEEYLENANGESIKNLVEKTIEKGLESRKEKWIGKFDGAKKRFLEIEDKFDNSEQAIQMAKRLDFLENLSHEGIRENVELQKQLYYNHLVSNKNFTDAEAKELISEADGMDKLEEKALASLPALKQSAEEFVAQAEKAKKDREENFKKQEAENYDKLMNTVDSTEEFVPGLKINKTVRDKVKKNMTTTVFTDEQYESLVWLVTEYLPFHCANFERIVSHKYNSKYYSDREKDCPGQYFDWERLKAHVLNSGFEISIYEG